MRLTRNIAFATTVAFSAIALMASSSVAQSIEASAEDGGHCSDVVLGSGHSVSGGCVLHIVSSNISWFDHNGMIEFAFGQDCNFELDAHVNEDGVGYVATDDDTVTGCIITACDEAAPSHNEPEWPIEFVESGSGEALLITFCLRPSSIAEGGHFGYCTLSLSVITNPVSHQQTFSATDTPCAEHPNNELTGTFVTSGGSEIELVH